MKELHLLLADDDVNSRLLFKKALKELPVHTRLTIVDDGKRLMDFFLKNNSHMPDILFLSLGMTYKKSSACLSEIKHQENLKSIPVIIYSNSIHEDVADVLYRMGAHYYIRKTNTTELKTALYHLLNLIKKKKLVRPERDNFIFNTHKEIS